MTSQSWKTFAELLFFDPITEFSLDMSRMGLSAQALSSYSTKFQTAFAEMAELEKGAIANQDEKRMVGHYWLRAPELAPTKEISNEIVSCLEDIKSFAQAIRSGSLQSKSKKRFHSVLVIGIGGSALGPQLANHSLANPNAGHPSEGLRFFIFDNTDPDGMARTLDSIPALDQTLVVVISKSGGTKETRNGQLIARAAFEGKGLNFAEHAVAVTGLGSELDKQAIADGFMKRFPMWDWVGGRTSELSAVGLLPAALQGFDIDQLLAGAKYMDTLTREPALQKNPAALLAAAWFHAGDGKGLKDMVVLPYKDRLELMSRYLQQLLMESLGKEKDRAGNIVRQGIAVYGNKGSTDQHAYVQQLRDGIPNFFAVFLEVLKDLPVNPSKTASLAAAHQVEPGITAGDYLAGFYLGTREALSQNDRQSVTITIKEVGEYSIGMLIALFERAVGLYASLININAYHQPGVEAGKKAATKVLEIQAKVVAALTNEPRTTEQLAQAAGYADEAETVFKILNRLAVNASIKRELQSPVTQSRFYR